MTMMDEARERERKRRRAKAGAAGANGEATPAAGESRGSCGQVPEPKEAPVLLAEPDKPVPPFPLEVLPEKLMDYAAELAAANNVPTDYTGCMVLGVAGGAIGNRRRLQIKPGHTQSACLFLAIVAPPGGAKSPTLEAVARPLQDEQWRRQRAWKKEKQEWAAKDPKERGDKPLLSRCVADGFTFEKLKELLAKNPEGLALPLDELRQIVCAINQYKQGRGTDRTDLLRLWSGVTLINDRCKDEEPVYIPKPFISIVGNIQPDLVQSLRGEDRKGRPADNDGGLDRFLFSFAEPPKECGERWQEVCPELEMAWDNAVRALLALEMDKDAESGDQRPRLLPLSGCGRDAWQRFTDAHAKEMNADDFPEHLRGPWSKLRAYCGRLALILDCLDFVSGDGGDTCRQVNGEAMDRAAKLVGYFKAHARKVYVTMDADPCVAGARSILDCLVRNPTLDRFTRRDLYQHLRRTFKRPDALDAPLKLLVDHQYLFAIAPDRTPGKPGPCWEKFAVNPLWTRTRNPQDPN
jgi:hypothetical protein